MGFRNLRMLPVLQPPPRSPPPKQHRAACGADADASGWVSAVAGALGGPASAQRQGLASHAASSLQQEQQEQQSEVPSLLAASVAAALRALCPASVCDVLQVADCLSPVVDELRR